MKNFVALMFFICVSACTEHEYEDEQAKELIANYYQDEREEHWSKTYECRPEEFKKLVSYQVYEQESRKDSQHWALEEYEILKIERDGRHVNARIKFVEKYLDSKMGGEQEPAYFQFVENTDWRIEESGNLTCINPGFRGHHAINRVSLKIS